MKSLSLRARHGWRRCRRRAQSSQQAFPESSGFCSHLARISPPRAGSVPTRAELAGPRPELSPRRMQRSWLALSTPQHRRPPPFTSARQTTSGGSLPCAAEVTCSVRRLGFTSMEKCGGKIAGVQCTPMEPKQFLTQRMQFAVSAERTAR